MFASMRISATGITASRERMEAAADNLANADSSAPNDQLLFRPLRVRLSQALSDLQDSRPGGVVARMERVALPPRVVYDPGHPDADAQGMVRYPDIDTSRQIADMMAARRAYEAGLACYGQARQTFLDTLDIIKA